MTVGLIATRSQNVAKSTGMRSTPVMQRCDARYQIRYDKITTDLSDNGCRPATVGPSIEPRSTHAEASASRARLVWAARHRIVRGERLSGVLPVAPATRPSNHGQPHVRRRWLL